MSKHEITSWTQLRNDNVYDWAKEKIKEATKDLPADEIRVTDIWGPNTVVWRDAAEVKEVGGKKAWAKAAELLGISRDELNDMATPYIALDDEAHPGQIVGALRVVSEAEEKA